MKCPKCQGINEQEAKFCIHCGAKLNLATTDSVEPSAPAEAQPNHQTGEITPALNAQTNEFVEKVVEISKDYWSFTLNALKSPYEASKRITDDKPNLINGLITAILFSLFLPLFTYFYTRRVSSGWLVPSFLEGVVIPFFVILIVTALSIAIVFAIVRLIKADIDILLVFTRFMTLMILPTALIIIAFVLSLINVLSISMLIAGLALFIVFLVSFQTIFSIKETHSRGGGIDVSYVFLINFFLLMIIFLLIGEAVLGSIMKQLDFLNYFF